VTARTVTASTTPYFCLILLLLKSFSGGIKADFARGFYRYSVALEIDANWQLVLFWVTHFEPRFLRHFTPFFIEGVFLSFQGLSSLNDRERPIPDPLLHIFSSFDQTHDLAHPSSASRPIGSPPCAGPSFSAHVFS